MTTSPIPGIAPAAAGATPVNSPDLQKLRKAAQAFEAVFLRQMIGSMRQAGLGDGIFDSDATKQFRDMSDAKTAEVMAQKGALGIADLLVKQYGARIVPSATPAGDAEPKAAK